MSERFILPDSLDRGGKIAVIATSNGVQKFPHVLDKGLERLQNRFDLQPVVYDTARESTEYLNQHHEQKAEELMKAFEDPEIGGVVALTGGTEQIRMLKHLEPERLEKNPTRFYGISDNTNLHIYLWNLGIQTFYGGQILDDLLTEGEIGEYTYSYLKRAFFKDSLGLLKESDNFTDDYLDFSKDKIQDDRERYDTPGWEFWNFEVDTVRGRVWGGNLRVISQQMRLTEHMPEQEELEGKILALETSEEHPESLELKRILLTMGEKGLLQKFSALIVGRPMRSPLFGEEKTLEEKQEYHDKQKKVLKEEIKRYCPNTPVVFDMDFGHTHPKIPLKMGGKLKINPVNQKVRFTD